MNRSFLQGLQLSDEAINSIMAEAGKDIQTLQNKITELTSTVEGKDAIINTSKNDFDARVKSEVKKITDGIVIKNSIKEKFKDVDPDVAELLMSRIDKNKISLGDDGTIAGLDEQYNELSTKYAKLLKKEEQKSGSTGGIATGGTPENGSGYANDYLTYRAQRQKELKGE